MDSEWVLVVSLALLLDSGQDPSLMVTKGLVQGLILLVGS